MYRRRFIPNEIIELKEDLILEISSDIIITKWKVFRPKHNFDWGYSCYFLNDGFKISKFFDKNNNFVYWYCDIISTDFDETENTYLFNDLLVDVIVYKNGFVKVLDLEELADALEINIIDVNLVKYALRQLNSLLNIIYNGRFDELTKNIQNIKGDC